MNPVSIYHIVIDYCILLHLLFINRCRRRNKADVEATVQAAQDAAVFR